MPAQPEWEPDTTNDNWYVPPSGVTTQEEPTSDASTSSNFNNVVSD